MSRPLRLAHESLGPAAGPAVLLLHGFPFSRAMWRPVGTRLAQEGYRVVLPDLPGFGETKPGEGALSMADAAEAAIDLAEGLGLERIALVGFSMGGYVALEAARRVPHLLCGLVLVDTRAEADPEEAARGRHETAARVRRDGMRVLADAMLPTLLSEHTRREKPDVVELARRLILSNPPEGAAHALLGMAARRDHRSFLPSLHVPTLIMVGEEDALTPPSAAEAMHQAIAGASLARIPRAAHLTPLEAPGEVARLLSEWMAKQGIF